jgi:hypothetical protein
MDVLKVGRFVEEDVLYPWTFCIGGRFVERTFCQEGCYVEGRFVDGRFVVVPSKVLLQNVLSNLIILASSMLIFLSL